ncbi:MAG TPA: TonB-dependent receptor [Thermoanaerobaculia bacterium]|nr:TonB-dependent receptor [Thermoanaerobaculia bacterium]
MSKFSRLIVFLLFLFPLTLRAQELLPPAIEAKDEIVVTASAVPEPIGSSPAATTVVTKADMERREARDIADVLREVPGLELSRSGSAGKSTTLFTRGANSTQTLVLWNGVKLNNPYFSGYDWGRFSTAGVDRVEIVRGPFSALYGSDAMGGVVNILTTPAQSGFSANVQGGGNGLFHSALEGSWKRGPLSVDGAYVHRKDDGFSRNDDLSQDSGNVGLHFAQGNVQAGLLARYDRYDLGIPFNLNGTASALVPSLRRRQNGDEWQIDAPFVVTVGRFQMNASLSDNRHLDDFVDPEDPFGSTFSSTRSNTYRGAWRAQTQTAAGLLIGGVEYETAKVKDASNFGPSVDGHSRRATSIFFEDRYSRQLSSSARLELSVGARNDDFSSFGSELSPRFGAALVAGTNKWRAGYGHAFRAPSIGELYFPFAGNPDLDPEKSRSFEIGYDHYFRSSSASVTLFHNKFDNLIVFDNARFSFQNTGRATTQGLELGLDGAITDHFRGALSYTWLDTNQPDTGKSLLRRPRNSGSLSFFYDLGGLATGLVVLRSGDRADVLPIAPFSRALNRAYTTVDWNLQYRAGGVTPYLKLENLTDARYEEVLGYRSPGRRALIGLRFALR